jgi:hypothetical protein
VKETVYILQQRTHHGWEPYAPEKSVWKDLNALHAFIAVLQDVEYIDVRRCDFDAVWLVVGSQGPEFKIIEAPLNGSQTTRKDSILKTMVPYDTFKTDMNRFLIAIVDRQKQGQEAAAEGDRSAARQYAQDVEDLTDVFDALQSGDYQAAFDKTWHLDTIVRDQIPKRLYSFIDKVAGCR